MKRLRPEKLHVRFLAGATPEGPIVPRKYTLTHSDRTGDLFLTIGPNYNRQQLRGLHARLFRDEALGEWLLHEETYELHIYVHVSGGLVIGTAAWRNKILHKEMPLVMEAITYAEKYLLQRSPELCNSSIFVHFHSHRKKYNVIETWGVLEDYA